MSCIKLIANRMNDVQDWTPTTVTRVSPTTTAQATNYDVSIGASSTTELTVKTTDPTTSNRDRSTPAAGFQEYFLFSA